MGDPITEEMAPSSPSDSKTRPPTVHTVPKLLSPAATLWLQSRSLPGQDKKYRRAGEDRPITLENLRIALRLLRLSVPRCIALFTTGMEVRVIAVLADRLAGCILPTMSIWAYSRMMDVVQKSLAGDPVDEIEVIRVVFVAMSCTTAYDILRYILSENDARVQAHVDNVLERAYLAAQLSLPISATTSAYFSALLHEAGIFSGHEQRATRGAADWQFPHTAYFCLMTAVGLMTDFIAVLSQIYLMYRTISSGESSSGSTGLFLIGLSLASTLVGGIVDMMRAPEEEVRHEYDTVGRNIQDMVRRGGGKQEAILFGLKDWALERWDKFKSESDADAARRRRRGTGPELGVVVLEQSVQYSFYILLALKVLPTSLSLGSLRLYQGTVDHLLRSLRYLSRKVNTVFQLVFYIAAYTEAVQLPDNPQLFRPTSSVEIDLLNFDDHRLDGGMSIVASNLSFRYPEAEMDVLRGINLTILPGTTLAIVGLNGSGKTTLIKALMGMYEHHGSLLLNGRPITVYDPATIHRRTSCLFQDFCQYSFTLRENVGIGNVARMGDDEALKVAMDRGGASGIKDKVGLDGKLSRWGIGSGNETDDEVQLHGLNTAAPGKAGRWQSLVGRCRGLAMAVRAWYTGDSMRAGEDTKAALSETGIAPDTTAPNGVSGAATLTAANPEAPTTNQLKLNATNSIKDGPSAARAEYSAGLSGGQWQKIGLSRAFMRASEADLVVFDEPSASLDPRAEAQLFERIHTLSHQGGRKVTTIYISHRFATVRKADQIAVVEDGAILECGSHAELMARAGRYRELYDIQKAAFEDQ